MKKLYVSCLIVAFITGIGTVNDAYMRMTERDSDLIPQVSRIDSEYIMVSALGQSGYVNTADMYAQVNRVRYEASLMAKKLSDKVTVALGMKEKQEEPARQAYGLEIL